MEKALITLKDAVAKAAQMPNPLVESQEPLFPDQRQRIGKMSVGNVRRWVDREVVSPAVTIISRGSAGGRRGYYPASLPCEIAIATVMSNKGYSLDSIAGARKLAQAALVNPSDALAGIIEEPVLGPAAREWLTLYAALTGDQIAALVLTQAQKLTRMILEDLKGSLSPSIAKGKGDVVG